MGGVGLGFTTLTSNYGLPWRVLPYGWCKRHPNGMGVCQGPGTYRTSHWELQFQVPELEIPIKHIYRAYFTNWEGLTLWSVIFFFIHPEWWVFATIHMFACRFHFYHFWKLITSLTHTQSGTYLTAPSLSGCFGTKPNHGSSHGERRKASTIRRWGESEPTTMVLLWVYYCTLWLFVTVCHGKSPFFIGKNHLFQWAIYTMANCSTTHQSQSCGAAGLHPLVVLIWFQVTIQWYAITFQKMILYVMKIKTIVYKCNIYIYILCVCTSSRKSMKFMNLHGNFPSWARSVAQPLHSSFQHQETFPCCLGSQILEPHGIKMRPRDLPKRAEESSAAYSINI